MEIKDILKKVKEEIVPDDSYKNKINKEINDFLKKINSLIKLKKLKAKAILGGSFAKDSYLKNDFDVDIFVIFNKKYKNEDISNLLENSIKKLKYKKIHGSRDYFNIKKKYNFELVPVLELGNNNYQNITDMSPLHVKWVIENLKKDQNNEIRILKYFCKCNRIYGAESYIKGFSGHVLDILIIYYGSFLNLLNEATRWKNKEVIDLLNFHKGKAIKNLNNAKIQSPLIVIDPISQDRNASASLSKENFEKFKKIARNFLENPSFSFFEKKVIDKKKLLETKNKNKLIIFDIKTSEGNKDVIGSKILKTYNYILNKFINNTFNIINSGWEWDCKNKAMLWYIAKHEMLEKDFLRVGPLLYQQYHVNLFKKKHKEFFEKEGRIFSKVKRKYRKIEKLAKDLSNDLISDKILKIEMKYYKP